MADIKENVIEWITGDDVIACTFTQRRFINKIYKLREKQPEIVSFFVQNADGSIFCHLPLKALKLYLKTGDEAEIENKSAAIANGGETPENEADSEDADEWELKDMIEDTEEDDG